MNEISLAEYRRQIDSAIEQGRHEEAVAHVRRILEAYPKDIGAYWLLGRAMLEAGQDERAVDVLRRVLAADPEHVLAWVRMSEVARRRGELEAAVWYLERAFELATEDEVVAGELRHLYGELAGSEPERLQLTQGALARLYLRGDLLTRAINELRELLEEHPDRLDLKVALVEALWHDGQRLQASELCQEILDGQPHNLKANLILGEIWTSSGRTEGEFYLERARAVDPENQMAQKLFGPASPLPAESPLITPLDYAFAPGERPPVWSADLGAPRVPEPFALAETGEVMEAAIEIPAWLEEIAGEGTREMDLAVESVAGEPAARPEEALDEMIGEEEAAMEEVSEEEVLEWLRQLDEEEVPLGPQEEEKILPEALEEEEIPAWLAALDFEPPKEEMESEAEEAALGLEPQEVEIPDWLLDLVPPEAESPETVPSEPAAALREVEAAVEETPPAQEVEELIERPLRLDRDDIPPADEALAWLQQLTEGEERVLPVEAE
ncbi:MAG: tetratricopeptide repeat protein, partial [Anaerolineae bacterium]